MMRSLVRRFACVLTALALLCVPAFAEISWECTTAGQQQLLTYVERVNANLTQLGYTPVNSLFEIYTTGASLGITAVDGAEIPEDIELTFSLYAESINILTLRVSRIDQFAAVAGSCIQAASPNTMTLDDAMTDPTIYMNRVLSEPTNSFEDTVTELNGASPRAYYAYFPNQYHDGVNWLQFTLVFPMAGAEEAPFAATEAPAATTPPPENEGYFAKDDLTHLEIFTTATPEPDSAAGEELTRP